MELRQILIVAANFADAFGWTLVAQVLRAIASSPDLLELFRRLIGGQDDPQVLLDRVREFVPDATAIVLDEAVAAVGLCHGDDNCAYEHESE